MTNQAYTDEFTLSGADTEVYEAIATLEFGGRRAGTHDIADSTGLDEGTVMRAVRSLTRRGVLRRHEEEAEPTWEPAYRGWSAAPAQAQNPAR